VTRGGARTSRRKREKKGGNITQKQLRVKVEFSNSGRAFRGGYIRGEGGWGGREKTFKDGEDKGEKGEPPRTILRVTGRWQCSGCQKEKLKDEKEVP